MKIAKIQENLINNPWLITQDAYIGMQFAFERYLEDFGRVDDLDIEESVARDYISEGVAVVPIQGTLMRGISEDVAKQTARAAVDAYNAKKKHDWFPYKPSSLEQIFKHETDVNGVETGNFIIKTVKKTYGEKGNAPKVWLSDGREAPEGFRITNGSECHALLYLAPWNYAGKSGVQFRLKGIKVNLLADAPAMDDPFANDPNAKPAMNGSIDDELDSLMGNLAAQKPPSAGSDFNDEIPF